MPVLKGGPNAKFAFDFSMRLAGQCRGAERRATGCSSTDQGGGKRLINAANLILNKLLRICGRFRHFDTAPCGVWSRRKLVHVF